MKTYDYIITLKSRSPKTVDRISLLMILLAVTAFVYYIFTAQQINTNFFLVVISILIVAYTVYVKIQERKGKTPYYRRALVLAALGWYVLPHELITSIACVAYLLAAMLEKLAKFPQEIAFDKDEIVFNSLPRKHYIWSDLSNVVLKDNLLTIDFKNNKLVQKETESAVTDKTEQEFNEFCKKQLGVIADF